MQVGKLPKRTNRQSRITDSGGSGKILKTQSFNTNNSNININ